MLNHHPKYDFLLAKHVAVVLNVCIFV